ncbi:MAG: hypothetical protein MUC68_05880, partial [Burkholderiaceae bacterium]|nr:hypothetical protein [Burkholderiaceae bacterium]
MKREPATPLLARPGAGPRGALRGRSAAAAPTATDIGRVGRALAVPAAANVVAPRAAASPGRVDREAGAAAFAGARLRATAQATARRIASGVQAPSAPADVS